MALFYFVLVKTEKLEREMKHKSNSRSETTETQIPQTCLWQPFCFFNSSYEMLLFIRNQQWIDEKKYRQFFEMLEFESF